MKDTIDSFNSFKKSGAMLEISDNISKRSLIRVFRDVDLAFFGNHLNTSNVYRFNVQVGFKSFSFSGFKHRNRFLKKQYNKGYVKVNNTNSYCLGLKNIDDLENEIKKILHNVFVEYKDTLLEIKYDG